MSDDTPRRRAGESAGIDWDAQPLGKVTDAALARRLGVSRTAVQLARVRRRIRRFRGPRGPNPAMARSRKPSPSQSTSSQPEPDPSGIVASGEPDASSQSVVPSQSRLP